MTTLKPSRYRKHRRQPGGTEPMRFGAKAADRGRRAPAGARNQRATEKLRFGLAPESPPAPLATLGDLWPK